MSSMAGCPRLWSRSNRVLARAPDHAVARARRDEILAAVEARRRQETVARDAAAVIEAAKQRFDAGEHAAAIALLEAFPHLILRSLARSTSSQRNAPRSTAGGTGGRTAKARRGRSGAVERARRLLERNEFARRCSGPR